MVQIQLFTLSLINVSVSLLIMFHVVFFSFYDTEGAIEMVMCNLPMFVLGLDFYHDQSGKIVFV